MAEKEDVKEITQKDKIINYAIGGTEAAIGFLGSSKLIKLSGGKNPVIKMAGAIGLAFVYLDGFWRLFGNEMLTQKLDDYSMTTSPVLYLSKKAIQDIQNKFDEKDNALTTEELQSLLTEEQHLLSEAIIDTDKFETTEIDGVYVDSVVKQEQFMKQITQQ
jgi:hypothetical protein